MPTKRLAYGLAALALVLTVLGCSDDYVPPTIPDSGPLVDRCLASGDMAVVLAYRASLDAGVDSGAPNPTMEAYDCTLTPECASLYFNEELVAAYDCVNDCLDSKPSGSLSIQCRDCFTLEAVSCAGTYCFDQCVGGNAASCTDCFDTICIDPLNACIGF